MSGPTLGPRPHALQQAGVACPNLCGRIAAHGLSIQIQLPQLHYSHQTRLP